MKNPYEGINLGLLAPPVATALNKTFLMTRSFSFKVKNKRLEIGDIAAAQGANVAAVRLFTTKRTPNFAKKYYHVYVIYIMFNFELL